MLRLLYPKHNVATIFENHLNPVMLVFIGKLSLITLRWVPMCQGFSNFHCFLHHFVLAKLATSSIRVNDVSTALITLPTYVIKHKQDVCSVCAAVIGSALMLLRCLENEIEHIYWVQAGYISWSPVVAQVMHRVLLASSPCDVRLSFSPSSNRRYMRYIRLWQKVPQPAFPVWCVWGIYF